MQPPVTRYLPTGGTIEEMLKRMTLEEVNGAIREHLRATDLDVVVITADAEGFAICRRGCDHSRKRRDGAWSVSGLLRPDEVASATGIALPEHDDYDTVAGLFLQLLGRMPEPGDEVVVELPVRVDEQGEPFEAEEAVIVVERLDGLRIDRLALTSRAATVEEAADE